MHPHTVEKLNALNRQFYQTIGQNFDETRQSPWEGWQILLPDLQSHLPLGPLNVLDVGCGNGRFGAFLAGAGLQIHYTGVDFNPYLLAKAQKTLAPVCLSLALQEADLLAYRPQGPYDLIVIFGVLHHIPSFVARQGLLEKLFSHLRPGGLLAATAWIFYEQERFRQRIIPWEAPQVPEPLQGLDLEEGDYLLDWRGGESALRYCHYISPVEWGELLAGWPQLASFDADTANRYALCQAPNPTPTAANPPPGG